MLANCANPLCSTSLRRLAEGELLRLETVPALGLSKACRVEYFWLCHRCSSVMTLRLKEDRTVGAGSVTRSDSRRPRPCHSCVGTSTERANAPWC